MKKSLLWLLAAAPLSVWAQSKPYTISGQLKNVPATQTWVYIGLYKSGQPALDSAKVTEGKYTFTGTTEDEPTFGSLFFGKPVQGLPTPPSNVTNIFVEPGNIQVTHVDSFSNATVTGSPANAELVKLNKIQDPIAEKMQPLMKAYRAAYAQGDKETMKQLEAQGNALEEESNAAYETYLKQNPTSPIALYVIQRWMPYAIDAEKLAPVFAKLPATMVSSKTGQALKAKMEVAEKTSIGKAAPDFSQNDTLGNPVKLSSLRGKYVLVDFWASWCRPCRAENPNVVKAFNQYKDKGFTVLGVSLDQPDGKAKWLKAIHDDGLTWTHVSDLQFWNNAAAKEYGVQSIPQNFLIDPQGNIAGKNLRGEDLEKKLAELIKG